MRSSLLLLRGAGYRTIPMEKSYLYFHTNFALQSLTRIMPINWMLPASRAAVVRSNEAKVLTLTEEYEGIQSVMNNVFFQTRMPACHPGPHYETTTIYMCISDHCLLSAPNRDAPEPGFDVLDLSHVLGPSRALSKKDSILGMQRIKLGGKVCYICFVCYIFFC